MHLLADAWAAVVGIWELLDMNLGGAGTQTAALGFGGASDPAPQQVKQQLQRNTTDLTWSVLAVL
jgi:hypothetical protein